MQQPIKIVILEDGEMKIDTGEIGEEYHRRADDFLNTIKHLMGGEVTTEPVKETEGVVDHDTEQHTSH